MIHLLSLPRYVPIERPTKRGTIFKHFPTGAEKCYQEEPAYLHLPHPFHVRGIFAGSNTSGPYFFKRQKHSWKCKDARIRFKCARIPDPVCSLRIAACSSSRGFTAGRCLLRNHSSSVIVFPIRRSFDCFVDFASLVPDKAPCSVAVVNPRSSIIFSATSFD